LHVEVGGGYGGSQRALQLYLSGCDRSLFSHDVLFIYPAQGNEYFVPVAGRVQTLLPAQRPPAADRGGAGGWKNACPGWMRNAWRVLYPWLDFVRSIPLAFRIADFIRRGDYGLVHVNNTFSFHPATLAAARLVGVPVIAHQRNPVPNTLFSRLSARLTGGIACVNPLQASELSAFVAAPVRVCRDPIGKLKVNEEVTASLRQSLAPEGQILVGSTGRLSAQKGYRFLIEAAALVVSRNKSVRFVIAGEGEERDALERLADKLGLRDYVRLLGFRQDIGSVLASFDVFVSSSLWEGLPLSVLEAMQLGKPIVCTPAGAPPGVAPEAAGVEVVPAENANALAGAILTLVGDAERRKRMAAAAKSASASMEDERSISEFDKFAHEVAEVGHSQRLRHA
jgi:glycosyltransferase involved in cell wall biosynthesis